METKATSNSSVRMIDYLTTIEFCNGLFGYMKKIGIDEFNMDKLEYFINLKSEKEIFYPLFTEINKKTVIETGVSIFEIIGVVDRNILSPIPKVKLNFSEDITQTLIDSIPIQYRILIEQLVLEFYSFNSQKTMTKKLTKI